jgi:xanthine dehydrogenase accessory factor
MFEQFLKKSAELVESGESFAVATVVRCHPPTSGKPGDKAIIRANGELWGWIGGGCAQPVVVKEAVKALQQRRPALVRISPSPNDPEQGIVDYTMSCHSGGAMDIYIEPVIAKPQIVILGRSAVALALARLGRAIDYSVTVVAEKIEVADFADSKLLEQRDFDLSKVRALEEAFVVVSTQGEGDEEALEQALRSSASYVAFVASATKASKVTEFLRTKKIPESRLAQLRAPAGLNIGATAPREIAVSILAEIVKLQHAAQVEPIKEAKPAQLLPVIATEDRDPICGMMVNPATARYKSKFRGKSFSFCCAGCKQAFDKEPEKYLAVGA